MATNKYFEETIKNQCDKSSMDLEIGSTGNSIYIKADDKVVIMDRATAKRFVKAVAAVGFYYRFID